MTPKYDLLWKIVIFALFSWVYISAGHAEEIDLKALAQVESSGNPLAVSFLGAKYGRGLYQVSEVALQDYNASNSPTISPEQLFDPIIGEKVAKWYIGALKRYLRHYGVEPTLENLLSAYNLGAKSVANGKRADKYIQKYYKARGKQ